MPFIHQEVQDFVTYLGKGYGQQICNKYGQNTRTSMLRFLYERCGVTRHCERELMVTPLMGNKELLPLKTGARMDRSREWTPSPDERLGRWLLKLVKKTLGPTVQRLRFSCSYWKASVGD